MKEYNNPKSRFLLPVYSHEINEWDDLYYFNANTDYFVMLLLADYSKKPMDEIANAAKVLIDNGLRYICCWGPESTLGKFGFDIGNLDWEEENKKDLRVGSTSHEDSLADAVWFCLYCAAPDDEFWTRCSIVIVNMNNEASPKELDKLLNDCDYLDKESDVT